LYKQKKALGLLALLLLSINSEAKINIPLSDEKQKLCEEIFLKMTEDHFFNDKDLSAVNAEMFDSLLDRLDADRIYFTEHETVTFKRKFSKFDDLSSYQRKYAKSPLCSIDLESKFKFINLYFNRLIEVTNYQLKEVTKKNFDYTHDEK